MNLPSQKRCFPRQMGKGGRRRLSALLSITQEICGQAPHRAQPHAPITARVSLPADMGKRKSLREENNETRISTHSQITTLNTFGATQVLLPTMSPMAQSWLDIKYQLPGRLGWAASSSCLPAPVLFTWNHWSWCPTIKLQPAHDVFTMPDWETFTQIFIVPQHGTGKCPGHQY